MGSGIVRRKKHVICGVLTTAFSFRGGLLEGFLTLAKYFAEAS
jgi:hypothetical protein